MKQESMDRYIIQSFRQIIYYTCVFNMACVTACECDHQIFQPRPDERNTSMTKSYVQYHWQWISSKPDHLYSNSHKTSPPWPFCRILFSCHMDILFENLYNKKYMLQGYIKNIFPSLQVSSAIKSLLGKI